VLLASLLSVLLGARALFDAAFHARAVVVDAHSDCTQRMTYDGVDLGTPQPDMQVDLAKMKQGGLDAQFFSIFVGPWQSAPEGYFAEAERQFAAVHAMIRAHPKAIAWARTAADVRRNARRGVLSALFGVEGGHALLPGDTPEMLRHLRTFCTEGARYLTLTWSIRSPLGGSSGDDSDGEGLTDAGREIIDAMHRLGVMVDVSHVSDPLFWDVVRYVRKPVIASHSSARALANVPRNMTDAMLRAVARNGGAVCVNYGPEFLDEDFARAQQAIRERVRGLGLAPRDAWRTARDEIRHLPPVPLSRLVDHIDHVAKVAGIDHVCLGSDFDGVASAPAGLEDVSKLPALTAALRARGYGGADLEKILGGNLLRVLEANEVPGGPCPGAD
jgi:membrane dipeptidase